MVPRRGHEAVRTQSRELSGYLPGHEPSMPAPLCPSLLRFLRACRSILEAFQPRSTWRTFFLPFHRLLRLTSLLGDPRISLWLFFMNTIRIDIKFAIWYKEKRERERRSFCCSYHVSVYRLNAFRVLNYWILTTATWGKWPLLSLLSWFLHMWKLRRDGLGASEFHSQDSSRTRIWT